MRSWISSLVRERLLDVALALALGTALVTLAEEFVAVGVGALAQNVGRNPYAEDDPTGILDLYYPPQLLNFSIGDTFVVYGEALAAILTLWLLTIVAVVIVRRRDRVLGICPSCASRIPYESTHCAYCGSSVAPSEP